MYGVEDKRDIIKLINRYFKRNCEDDELVLYSNVCDTLQRIVFNYGESNTDFQVIREDTKFVVDILDSEYRLEVVIELVHRNVENIHYSVREVIILNDNVKTSIKDSDGYIIVKSITTEVV